VSVKKQLDVAAKVNNHHQATQESKVEITTAVY